ncbi:hypothetical protein SYK_06850 [Pseudodesulfovibrio nedwellii]|uniref:DUF4280 domain-containing protein n=1 Tax=Pseudodesulfovibrio nedwellii TaxID=2973072 RepID=A0ABM8AXT1_9BACT|nr:hypothetical protein [Pseudodesulfovibrio nedwellii]BDQ36325.1 hypothetical protein SYK_06850 [Pseudodesulfovibrio nedwellii]
MSRPCYNAKVAELLPCYGPDGFCYGKPTWEKKPFNHGEKVKAKTVRHCGYRGQCINWWIKSPSTEGFEK